ncbi:MAG: NADH-quinone oxidoreductase subunit L [Bacteroidetes bacterium]|nr:NADH-quinone oxidoreductase subunit L [Bacteroidota bacterium]MBS1649072.1 NADH-quinone oxidoreductase subunit L [Bacteroidota bacterium]
MNYSTAIWIMLLPLANFVLLGLGKKYLKNIAGIFSTILLFVAAAIALNIAYHYFFVDGKQNGVYQTINVCQMHWLSFTETMNVEIGIQLDALSVMMLVVVTFISLMVHLFSLGYMKGEERYCNYFSYLGLFTFSMLGLVVATNLLQLYMCWELVGISSYLLIGFYFQKPSAVAAAKKAFIVTRFADLGLLIGILILSFNTNSFHFQTIIQTLTNTQSPSFISITASSFLGMSTLTWALVLIFIGGAGKSAMLPLHIWLPDAMEGPTPVSALIHAATMVVAGVFLVAKLFAVFAIDVTALNIVAYVGTASALFAAIIACTQTDIKRVLAYSTMSQIGYMMFALGVSKYGSEEGLGYSAALFHLFTHAFFKSLLFLCAGAVIHLVHSNEMKDMGGLKKLMPITHIAFLIACLAIAGVPPFAGFFSKEEILSAAYQNNKTIYIIALLTSAITAFYMFRLYFSIFWNKPYQHHHHHRGEGTITMKLPLIILMLCAATVGFIPFSEFVSSDNHPFHSEIHIGFSVLPVALGLFGIAMAALFYFKQSDKPDKIANSLQVIYKAAYRKFYVDELYLFITKKIIFNCIAKPAAWIDKNIIDGCMNGVAFVTSFISSSIKNMQSGKVQQYALYFFAGIAALLVTVLYVWK